MRKTILASLMLLALVSSSCDNLETDLRESEFVTLSVNALTIEGEPLVSKSRVSANESEATRICLCIFDSDNKRVYKGEQLKSDENITFGIFTGIRLVKGDYKIVVVAYNDYGTDAVADITSPTIATIGQTGIREVYSTEKDISIDPDNGAAQNVQISLPLSGTKMVFNIMDKIPSDVAYISITINEGQLPASAITFNPSTGLLSSNSSFTRDVDVREYTGQMPTINVYAFLNEYPKKCSIKIKCEDVNKVTLYSHTYNNVEFKSGHIIRVGAYIFSQSLAPSLDFSEWIEDSEILLE